MATKAITRMRGDTAADQITVQTSSGGVLDVTGYTFTLTVSSLQNPPNANYALYTITGIIIDVAGGVVEFVPTLANADQKSSTYYYDIQMTDDIGRIKTIAKDEYIYTQDITK